MEAFKLELFLISIHHGTEHLQYRMKYWNLILLADIGILLPYIVLDSVVWAIRCKRVDVDFLSQPFVCWTG